jgi:hypothetical protein
MRSSIFYALIFFLAVTFLSMTPTDLSGQSGEQSQTSDDSYVTGMTSGRARSLIGVGLALVSVVVGWRVKKRPGNNRVWAFIALAAGILGMLVSIMQLAKNTGGFGTGGGKAGAIVALILGTTGIFINGLTLRSRKSAK